MISDAVYDAIGVRLMQTPFRPERVKEAISRTDRGWWRGVCLRLFA